MGLLHWFGSRVVYKGKDNLQLSLTLSNRTTICSNEYANSKYVAEKQEKQYG